MSSEIESLESVVYHTFKFSGFLGKVLYNSRGLLWLSCYFQCFIFSKDSSNLFIFQIQNVSIMKHLMTIRNETPDFPS